MDRVFMKIMVIQASIDVIFNAYQRHPAFNMSDDDIIHYCEHFSKTIDDILKIIKDLSEVAPKMEVQNETVLDYFIYYGSLFSSS